MGQTRVSTSLGAYRSDGGVNASPIRPLTSNAVRVCGSDRSVELGGHVPTTGLVHTVVTQSLVRKKQEEAVLDDWTAHAAAYLVEAAFIPVDRRTGAIPALERIQSGPVDLNEQAAMDLIRAVLGYDEDLRAAAPAIFRAVLVRLNLNFLDGFFVWSNQRRATPGQAVHLDAINLIAVAIVTCAVGNNAGLILRHKDARSRVGTNLVLTRQLHAATAATVGAIAENTWSQAE